MKLATWNINSVRLRFNAVARFLRNEAPDVLALQETKVVNDLFPARDFARLGYVHQAINGQKGYHGVAILSKLPFRSQAAREFCEKGDSRHMSAVFENGIELHNFYVPAGGDIPDPEVNDKFAHKLAFLHEMEEMFRTRRDRHSAPVVLVGDLNVAPLENDVWSHKQLLDVVSHTPVEVELFGNAREAFEWNDVTRQFVSEDQKIYSWWSYRAQDWRASDRGRRLDHIWTSPVLKNAVRSQKILKDMRGWKQPSDHVPVVAEFEV
ncbi:MAG TPA: exodeoxyribonuclease III [Rhizomicrobium sp.]|nr:exodeoxyribonuclease III [Rhizomicrobium sp.]